jgi:Rrf2 family iron-sulfur cluster assembly transcriptional regulator
MMENGKTLSVSAPALVELPLAARYGLEALALLSRSPRGSYHRVGDVAGRLELPSEFLAKVFRRLVRKGILSARRGPGGGYRLAADPTKLGLLEIADATLNAGTGPRSCLLFARSCGDGPCSAHESVMASEAALRSALGKLTLDDLAREIRPKAPKGSDVPAPRAEKRAPRPLD